MAVASNASAIPGATTANVEFLEAAIDWNECIIPQTVPKSPINGADEPTVASTWSCEESWATSLLIALFIDWDNLSLIPLLTP